MKDTEEWQFTLFRVPYIIVENDSLPTVSRLFDCYRVFHVTPIYGRFL